MERTFSIAEFARVNMPFLVWAAFAGLLYLFRNMLGLVFITFVMCYIAHSVVMFLHRASHLNRRLLIVALYSVFLTILTVFLVFLAPAIVGEAANFTDQLPQGEREFEKWIDGIQASYPWLPDIVARTRELLSPGDIVQQAWNLIRQLLEKSVQYVSWFFLGLLFSFIILLDLPRLTKSVQSLAHTRIAPVYQEVTESLVRFATVVGENFRAQILSATVDMVLIGIALTLMGLENAMLLSFLVFLCGLIPVVGVLMSSVPILLTTLNNGGISLSLWALGVIMVVAFIESYFVSPRILSSVMSLNPVVVIIILYIAYSLMGVWGMVLGIPIAVFMYQEITARCGGCVEQS